MDCWTLGLCFVVSGCGSPSLRIQPVTLECVGENNSLAQDPTGSITCSAR